MKQITTAFALFAILSAHTCNDSAGNSMTDLLDKKWAFESVNGQKIVMPDGAPTPWVQLAGDKLTGSGGCNDLMGSYKLGDGTIAFTGIGSTKKYCEGIQPTENAIKQALGAADAYKMEGGLLKLMGGGSEVAVLRAQ